MLTHWNKILSTDCKVVKIKDQIIYPIFRVGSTSIFKAAGEVYTNQEIKELNNMLVLIRNPEERFVSGLNEYCLQNNLDINTARNMVDKGKLIDRHFAPQYVWLLHLSKFYNGPITLLPFEHIKKITDIHMRKTVKSRIQVKPLKKFVNVDHELMTKIGQTLMLEPLVRRYKDVLS